MTRLTVKAIRVQEFPENVFVSGPTGRRARMRSGLDVWEILEPCLLAGKDWNILRQSYPEVDEAVLRTALRYYESYPEEIETRVDLNQSS